MVSYNCALDIDVAFLADRHRDPRCVEIKQVPPRAAAPSGYERTTHIVIHPGQPMTRPHAHRLKVRAAAHLAIADLDTGLGRHLSTEILRRVVPKVRRRWRRGPVRPELGAQIQPVGSVRGEPEAGEPRREQRISCGDLSFECGLPHLTRRGAVGDAVLVFGSGGVVSAQLGARSACSLLDMDAGWVQLLQLAVRPAKSAAAAAWSGSAGSVWARARWP
jgi:hypothetical protein